MEVEIPVRPPLGCATCYVRLPTCRMGIITQLSSVAVGLRARMSAKAVLWPCGLQVATCTGNAPERPTFRPMVPPSVTGLLPQVKMAWGTQSPARDPSLPPSVLKHQGTVFSL